jgi:hypothetical protein
MHLNENPELRRKIFDREVIDVAEDLDWMSSGH